MPHELFNVWCVCCVYLWLPIMPSDARPNINTRPPTLTSSSSNHLERRSHPLTIFTSFVLVLQQVGADSFTKAQVTLKQGKASDAAGKRAAAVQQYKAGLGYLVKVLGTIRDIPANKKKRDSIKISFTQVSHMLSTSPSPCQ